MILASLATLGAVVVAFVLYPVFAGRAATDPLALSDDATRELFELEDKKIRIYDALQDLEFEKDSGKISEADFESARTDYLAQVSAVMARMDELAPAVKSRAKSAKAREKAKAKRQDATVSCSSCGHENPKGSKFCLECGTALDKRCSSCGSSIPETAKFCNECGEKVTA